MLKALSYSGHPLTIRVKIHDIDITDDLASVDDIARGIDYPNLTEFRVGEASFTLRDVHGDFSPNNLSNFFTQHGGQHTGRNSPIEIEAGFIVNGTRHTETIFQGTIIRLVQDAKGATVKVVCSDNFGDMRKKAIADFGVPRHFMLTEDLEQTGGKRCLSDYGRNHAGFSWLCHVGDTRRRFNKSCPETCNGRHAQPSQLYYR